MNRFQKVILHPYFSYVYLFVAVFCLVCLLLLPTGHPLVYLVITIGLLIFILHRYRRTLLRKVVDKS